MSLLVYFTFPLLTQQNGFLEILPHIFLFVFFTQLSRLLAEVYNTSWRFAYIREYLRLIGSDLISGSVFIFIEIFIFSDFISGDYTTTLVECNILATLVGRFVYQLFYIKVKHTGKEDQGKIPVAIIGAEGIGENRILPHPRPPSMQLN
jgi:FlaA1/EpsC-like NDP-sugar epimerase